MARVFILAVTGGGGNVAGKGCMNEDGDDKLSKAKGVMNQSFFPWK